MWCTSPAAVIGLSVSMALSAGVPLSFAAAPRSAARVNPNGVEPEAAQAIRRMSAYLASLMSFETRAATRVDLVTDDGRRVAVESVTEYKVRRPDRFRIDVLSDHNSRQLFFDGRHFTVNAPELGYYATVPAPATIRETLDAVSVKVGIGLPLEDLFRWADPATSRFDELRSGLVVGPAIVDGVRTVQYAFREDGLDWQIWIQEGEAALPRKLVIMDRTDPSGPTYSARLSWNTAPTIDVNEFVFKPPFEGVAGMGRT